MCDSSYRGCSEYFRKWVFYSVYIRIALVGLAVEPHLYLPSLQMIIHQSPSQLHSQVPPPVGGSRFCPFFLSFLVIHAGPFPTNARVTSMICTQNKTQLLKKSIGNTSTTDGSLLQSGYWGSWSTWNVLENGACWSLVQLRTMLTEKASLKLEMMKESWYVHHYVDSGNQRTLIASPSPSLPSPEGFVLWIPERSNILESVWLSRLTHL